MFPMDSAAPLDIKNMGVDMVTLANNHGADYGTGGLLLENMRLLQAAGVPYAGAGNNLREARAATLVTTPKGRVTVVAAAGTFKDGFSAVDGRRGGDADRPGISLVRTTPINRVTAREMALLQQLNAMRREGAPAAPDTALPQRLTVLGQTYLLSDAPGISWQLNRNGFARDRAGGAHGEAKLRFHRVHDSRASVGNRWGRQQSCAGQIISLSSSTVSSMRVPTSSPAMGTI